MSHPLPTLSDEDFFDFLIRILPQHVTEKLASGGEESFRAIAKVWERMGQRVLDHAEAGLILQATGVARATGRIRALRTDTTERIGFRSGQVVAQTRWGVRFRLLEDLEWDAAVSEADDIDVEAELSGFDGNVEPGDIGRWGLPTGVDRTSEIAWLDGVTDSAKATLLAEVDLGTDFRDFDPAFGAWIEGKSGLGNFADGALATLDLLGAERGLPRIEGETDVQYRKRIRTLPDIVIPAAILRAAVAYLAGTGATVTLEEPWEFGWVVGDDPRGAIFDESPIAGLPSFVLMVDGLPFDAEGWAVLDDPLGAIGENPIGVGDPEHDAILAGLQDLVRTIRAAGVCGRVLEVA